MSLAARAQEAIRATEASADAVNAALEEYLQSSVLSARDVVVNRAGAIVADVAKASPVDSGRFRGAWGPALEAFGAPQVAMPAANQSGEPLDPRAIAQGRALGSGQVAETPDRIEAIARNGVRYGPFLEAGHSRQARAGFVRRILDRHAKRIRDALGNIQPRGAT